jgi:hypothetical protein
MKHLILTCTLLSVFCFPTQSEAQQKPVVEIISVKRVGNTVEFGLISATPFYMGNNAYVLYIGNKRFHISEQSTSEDQKGHLKFFIPLHTFNKLKEGQAIYLSYGFVSENEAMDMEQGSKDDMNRQWSLGKFSKKLLTQ